MPGTPSEAGLGEVKLKRKLGYKGYHRNEYINTKNIFKALKVLKEKGHPDYQHFDDLITYENRCKSSDPTGYHLVFEDNENELKKQFPSWEIKFADDEETECIVDLEDLDVEESDEIDYMKNDPINRSSGS